MGAPIRYLTSPFIPMQPLARVASFRTRLSFGTTALVTPPCHAFVACTPTSLFLVFPVRLQLRERFREDLPVLSLHYDQGGEFSSDLLRDFCRGEGILQLFMLPASPQHNGVAERRIGLVMEVARTSMIHAAAPHFLWTFAVGDALVFRVWGSRAFVRDTSADKLSYHANPCGPAPSGVSHVDPLPLAEHVEGIVDSGAAGGSAARGATSGGAEPAGAEPGGAEPASAEPGGCGVWGC
ncbi:unnamed protein product [Closterium sp. NIES-54]